MKLSYSKLVVHGVIATTLLMSMSCQKKGSARGVQPETVKAGPNLKAQPADEKNLTKDPGKNEPSQKTSGDNTSVKPVVEPAVLPKVEEKKSKGTTKVEKKADTTVKKDKDDEVIPEGQPGSKTNPAVLPEVVVVAKKAKTEPAEVPSVDSKECSEAVITSQKNMKSLLNKIEADGKVSTTTDETKKADYTSYYKQCVAWIKNFTKEKPSCETKEADKTVNLDAGTNNLSCYKYSIALKDLTGVANEYSKAADKVRAERLVQLKAKKFTLSEEAKEMFMKDHTAWKMFIVDGTIQTDGAKLKDAVKENKVACTISSAAKDRFNDGQDVILSITAVTDYQATDEADAVQTGVELGLSIKATDKDATTEEKSKVVAEKLSMFCSGLNHKDLNTKVLAKAFGKQIAVEVPAVAGTSSPDATKAKTKN